MTKAADEQLVKLEALYKALVGLVAFLIVGVGVASIFAFMAWMDAKHNSTILNDRSDTICGINEAHDLDSPYCERLNQ